jgi:hypothetical protein
MSFLDFVWSVQRKMQVARLFEGLLALWLPPRHLISGGNKNDRLRDLQSELLRASEIPECLLSLGWVHRSCTYADSIEVSYHEGKGGD